MSAVVLAVDCQAQLSVDSAALAAGRWPFLRRVPIPRLVLQGVALVFDTVAGRNFSLVETAAEFLHRYRTAHPEAAKPDALSGMQYQANGKHANFMHGESEGKTAVQVTILLLTFA